MKTRARKFWFALVRCVHRAADKRLLAIWIVFVLLFQPLLVGTKYAEAASYTFVQESWAGGLDSLAATHTTDRTGWTKYYSADSGIEVVSGTVKLAKSTTTSSWVQTTANDFSGGTVGSGSFVVGSENGGGVALCKYDHGGADWTPSEGDGYDLNGGTTGIYISGSHCNIGSFSVPSGTVYVMPYDGSKYGILRIFASSISVSGTLSAVASGFNTNYLGGRTDGPAGSHGGVGGDGVLSAYGSSTAPVTLGEGGYSYCDQTPAGKGGGAISLFASGSVSIGGTISANGANGTDRRGAVCGGTYSGGAGAGGSIYVSAPTISGDGVISAIGGTGGNGGGGGRIAIYYSVSTFEGTTSAAGGTSLYTAGASGTIHNAGASSYPGLIGYLNPANEGLGWHKLLGIELAHAGVASAEFTSSVKDTGLSLYQEFRSISWVGATSSAATIKFQVASSNSASGPWSYYGPTGDSDFYTTSSTTINSIHNGQRYVRYRMTLSSTEDLLDAPTLQSVTLTYDQSTYPASKELVGSPFNSEDPANTIARVLWTATTPTGTGVKFQLRTAPNSSGSPGTWTDFMGPGGTSGTYFTDPAGETVHTSIRDGSNDQWFQYKAFLISDGSDTPSLTGVQVVYVVNAPPEFDPAYGTSGINVSQISDSSDSNWGKMNISYSIRDTDTLTGTTNPGYITPTMQYQLADGTGWHSITSGFLSENALANKYVGELSSTLYTAYWDAASQIPGYATSSLAIRVTINDNELASNTASATMSNISLDTSSPTLSVLRHNSATNLIALMASDTVNNISYIISNNADLTADGVNAISGSWQNPGAATIDTSFAWAGTGGSSSESMTFVLRDAFNNRVSTTTLVSPAKPSSIDVKDTTNYTTGENRLFIAWPVYTNETGATFGNYNVSRSTDNVSFSEIATISNRLQNYYSDTGLSSSTTYYYKTNVSDTNGDTSEFTVVVYEKPDGQNASNNDHVPPTITGVATSSLTATQVTIAFTTDELANSSIEYSTTALGNYSSVATSTSYVTAHSITIPNLTPGTSYVYRVKAYDVAGNQGSSASATYTFTTSEGVVISAVTTSSINDASATVVWNTNASSDSYVYYATSTSALNLGNGTMAGSASLVTGADSIYQHSVQLTGLTSQTTYYYYVTSMDGSANLSSDNNSGNYYSFATTYDTVAPTITNVTPALTTSDSAIITWDTNEPADSQVSYGDSSGTLTSASVRNTTLSLGHSVTISGLTASRAYYFAVNSADARGNRATSTESTLETSATTQTIIRYLSSGGGCSATTGIDQSKYDKVVAERDALLKNKDTVAPVVTDVKVSDIGPFKATVTFTTSEDALPLVVVDKGGEYDRTAGTDVFGKSHSVSLPGLRFGTTYDLKIKAIDKWGNQSAYALSSFRTLFAAEVSDNLATLANAENFQDQLENIIDSVLPSLVPPFIGDISVTETGEDFATISWSTNTKTYGSVSYAKDGSYAKDPNTDPYDQNVSDNNDKGRIHTLTIRNLEPLTTYHAAINAFAIFGVNGRSKDLTFVTKPPRIRPEVSNVGNTQFTIFWKSTNPTSSRVSYKNMTTGDLGEKEIRDLVRSHAVTIDNLASDTLYEIRVGGKTTGGNPEDSTDVLRVRTILDNTAPTVGNVSISNAFIPGRTDRLQTVISWKTNEPSVGSVEYGEGAANSTLSSLANEEGILRTDHAVILTTLKPATLYRFQIISKDSSGNKGGSGIKAILTPRESESVFGIIIKNFEDTFGFLGR